MAHLGVVTRDTQELTRYIESVTRDTQEVHIGTVKRAHVRVVSRDTQEGHRRYILEQ